MMIAEDETGDREPRLASATGGYRRDEIWVNPLVKLYLRYRLKYHSKEWNEIQIRGYVRGMNEDWIEVKR